jgi:hypothetical protein
MHQGIRQSKISLNFSTGFLIEKMHIDFLGRYSVASKNKHTYKEVLLSMKIKCDRRI